MRKQRLSICKQRMIHAGALDVHREKICYPVQPLPTGKMLSDLPQYMQEMYKPRIIEPQKDGTYLLGTVMDKGAEITFNGIKDMKQSDPNAICPEACKKTIPAKLEWKGKTNHVYSNSSLCICEKQQ